MRDWIQTEWRVYLEEDAATEYSNNIGLEDIIRAGIHALRVDERIKFVETECTDAGF
jgi:hypothetical protein